MKAFIDQYRKFRHLCREEIGDLEDGEIMMLFSIYLEQRPQFNNPFSGLESFFTQYSSLFNPNNNPSDDPDDEDFNDDPFHNSSLGRW